jgi:hypothetical protein
MVPVFGVIVGIILGWLRGGRLEELRNVRLRFAWVVLPVVPLQLAIAAGLWRGLGDPPLAGALVIASYVPLVVFVLANLRLPGLAIAGVGLAANLVVMLANGGLMPVSPDSVRAAGFMQGQEIVAGMRTTSGKGVILPANQTRLAILSDTIVTPPLPRPRILSMGDILTFLGVALTVQLAMRRPTGAGSTGGRSAASLPLSRPD